MSWTVLGEPDWLWGVGIMTISMINDADDAVPGSLSQVNLWSGESVTSLHFAFLSLLDLIGGPIHPTLVALLDHLLSFLIFG